MGHTPEQGGAQTNAQNLFCFPHSCRGSPAHCRVPVGSEYLRSFPAILPGCYRTCFHQHQLLQSPAFAHPLPSRHGVSLPSPWQCSQHWLAALCPSWNARVPRKGFQFSHPIFTRLGKTEDLLTLKPHDVSPHNAELSNTKPTSLRAPAQSDQSLQDNLPPGQQGPGGSVSIRAG